MNEFTAKIERTYGLIVGIERYLESSWNVKGGGPAHDALKFAQWLDVRGVPKENIRLCLSPLEENNHLVEQSELARQEATEQNITALVTEFFSEKKGDLLYLFWAGHGLMTSERNRRLFCADATKRNWQNLDLNSLLVFLSSEAFQIQNHICIVDACANYILESKGRPTNLGGKTFSSGQPRKESQQFVLLAAREGETARVSRELKAGYFSHAVLEALKEEPNDRWPPDMEAIAKKVKQQVTTLDKKQLPIYLHCRSWNGETNTVNLNQPTLTHHSNGSSYIYNILLLDKDFEANFRQLSLKLLQLENAQDLTKQANKFLQDIAKEIRCLKRLTAWLRNKDVRLKLAIEIAGCIWKNLDDNSALTIDEKAEIKTDFIYNLYECLSCLFQSFGTAVHKEISSDIKSRLLQHDLDLYINAIRIFEEKAKAIFFQKEDQNVLLLMYEYTEKFIEDIS